MKSAESSNIEILTSGLGYCKEVGVVWMWSDMYRDHGEYIWTYMVRNRGSKEMDGCPLTEIEKWLAEQMEISRTTNENMEKPFTMISNMEVKNIAPPSPANAPSTPHVTTILSTLQPSWIRPAVPNNTDGDSKGHIFLTSCKLYTSLTVL
jgi:hypothetical protein